MRPVPDIPGADGRDFNPRTPCGVRHHIQTRQFGIVDFNPRTPCGVRPFQDFGNLFLRNFNPRTPCGVRRATINSFAAFSFDFNPRTPCGVRLRGRYAPMQKGYFNPRTPCGVRLYQSNLGREDAKNFNPRTPCGVRPIEINFKIYERNFNPRTPCGVRQQNCRNIPGKFAQKLQNFCKAKQRAALPRVGQRESSRYFRPCAVRTSRGKPERFRFASDNERALRSVARLCAEVLDAGFILVSKVIKA